MNVDIVWVQTRTAPQSSSPGPAGSYTAADESGWKNCLRKDYEPKTRSRQSSEDDHRPKRSLLPLRCPSATYSIRISSGGSSWSSRILGVACITDKVREARLIWFGHGQRREEEDCVRRILEADVCGQRSRGRQRKRWIDVVSTKWRTCGSTWWTWRIELSGYGEPVWLTPHPRDLNQPEGERERERFILLHCLPKKFTSFNSCTNCVVFHMSHVNYNCCCHCHIGS